jgi:hypothetical protein
MRAIDGSNAHVVVTCSACAGSRKQHELRAVMGGGGLSKRDAQPVDALARTCFPLCWIFIHFRDTPTAVPGRDTRQREEVSVHHSGSSCRDRHCQHW